MIDFQFLRDCVKALNEVQTNRFYMEDYLDEYPKESNNWCGTPACVLGHWLVREMSKMPTEERRFNPMLRLETLMTTVFSIKHGYGLTADQRDELFGSYGCDGAKTKKQAIAYLQHFIRLHGGSIEDPKPLDIAIVPDWKRIASEAKPVAVKEVV